MPTASGFPLWLTRAARALTWLTLALGLCLGAAWALLHVWIVPRIADFRPALEQLASRRMGMPVQIGQLHAESTGWVPSFELQDVRMLDAQGRAALTLPRVVLAISVRSLLNLGLEQLVLDRPELDVRRTTNGQWLIAGLALGGAEGDPSAFADWLFGQREAVVRGGTVRWHNTSDTEAAAPLALRDVDIVLRNGLRRHDWRIDATPPADWGERFVLMGRFQRGLLSAHPGRLRDWSGQLYAWFARVDVAQLRQHLPLGVDLQSGQGRLRLWSDFRQGQWVSGTVDTDLQQVHLQWAPSLQPLSMTQLTGRVSLTHDTQGWSVQTRGLAFTTPQGLHWPGGNVLVRQHLGAPKQAPRGELSADQIDLEALRDVALRLPLPAPWLTQLSQHLLAGQVRQLQLQWNGDVAEPRDLRGQIDAHALRVQAVDALHSPWPGVDGGDLELRFAPDGGQAQLKMPRGGALMLPRWFEQERLPVRHLQAQLQWQKKDGVWRVPQWRVQLDNEDLQGQAQGQWQASPRGPGRLDLQAHVVKARAEQVHRYLPVSLPAQVRHYVRESVQRGTVHDLHIRVRGDLADVPMRRPQDGEFQFAARLQDVDLDYVPPAWLSRGSTPWPVLRGLQGQLVFEREGMRLRGASAWLGERRQPVAVSRLQADIPDLAHQPALRVQADLKGQGAAVLRLLQSSPVDSMLSGALGAAQASGPLQGPLQLDIPLLHAENTRVRGQVQFSNNQLQMVPTLPMLDKVSGTLAYSESDFRLQDVRARWLGGPVRLEGGLTPGVANAPAPRLQLRAQGQLLAEGLRDGPGLSALEPLTRHLLGQTDYALSLDWRDGHPDLEVRSTLQGLALNLPAPLNKHASAAWPLHVRTRLPAGRGARESLELRLGHVLAAVYERDLSGATPSVVRGHVAVGAAATRLPELPRQGVTAQVSVPDLAADAWLDVWPERPVSGPSAMPSALTAYLPERTQLRAQTLRWQERTLHQLVASIGRQDDSWSAEVDAHELNGHVLYTPPSPTSPGRVRARLTRLDVPPSAMPGLDAAPDVAPTSIPSLDIHIEELGVHGLRLGQLAVEAVNQSVGTAREWRLHKFNLTTPEAALRASGRWGAVGPGAARRTELDFRLDVEDAGRLLTRLHLPDALRAGQGLLSGRVGWQGSPLSPDYPSMQGQMQIDVRQGQFLQADPGAAKLLGVLSLQALPRRFLLDFKDVFAQGYAFDTVKGDVQVRQGVAHTQNLQIRGVNAVVHMSGSADLARETQQLHVQIPPELSSAGTSLRAGLAINPAVGLTTYVTQWLFKKPLSQATRRELRIDGSWSAPRVTRLDDTAATESEPASGSTRP